MRTDQAETTRSSVDGPVPSAARASAWSTDVRWEVLGALRFLLAGIVACEHLSWFQDPPDPAVTALRALGAKAAVLGFFVVSGYSIAASLERGASGFYRRRFLRIYPVYFIALAATLALQTVLGVVSAPGYVFHPSGLVTFTGNVLMLQTFLVKPVVFNSAVWSLSIECFYYVLAPYFARMGNRTLGVLVLGSMLVYLVPKPNAWGPVFLVITKLNALRYLWPWLIGFLCFRRLGPGFVIGSAALGFCLVSIARWENPERLAPVTFLVSLAIVVIAPRLRMPRAFRPLHVYLGDLSYPLYVLQFPCFIACHALLGIDDPVVLILVLVAACVVCHQVVEVYLKEKYLKRLVNAIAEAWTRGILSTAGRVA